MKKPKISDLEYDEKGTKKIRHAIARAKKIKITVNIDEDVLGALKVIADKTGMPYQTLLNRLLRQSVGNKEAEVSRIERLEKDVALLKKKLSA
ncbi:MAG: BrnA antitoxin family protein [Bdellovibrionales bacterium]|nr:BrnA antitoxin family protein [Bdellovibrionales bacterium]